MENKQYYVVISLWEQDFLRINYVKIQIANFLGI